MGLGKTIQALGVASFYRQKWPLLIVAPASLLVQWKKEIENFLVGENGLISNSEDIVIVSKTKVSKKQQQQLEENQKSPAKGKGGNFKLGKVVSIVSYNLLATALDTLKEAKFKFLIADESHNAKSIKTGFYKNLSTLAKIADHVVLLSGSPAMNRPVELYTQLSLIWPEPLSKNDYESRYCEAHMDSFGNWNVSGATNLNELNVIFRTQAIRRLKQDVLGDMPPKKRLVQQISLPYEISIQLSSLHKRLRQSAKRKMMLHFFFFI